MSEPNATSADSLGLAVLKALGLENQLVEELTIHFRGAQLPTVKATILLKDESKDEGFARELQHFTLVPKETPGA